MTVSVVGNDKSGVFVETFVVSNPPLVSNYLAGIFRWSKNHPLVKRAYAFKDGYVLDFEFMVIDIYKEVMQHSYSNAKKQSFLIKLRLNPIRFYNDSYFNFLQQSFSFDDTKKMFTQCLEFLKDFFKQFCDLDEHTRRHFLFPEKVKVSDLINNYFDNLYYGKNVDGEILTNKDGFIRFLKEKKTYVEKVDVFVTTYINGLEFTDFFELSITADVRFDNHNDKIAFFQSIQNFSLSNYLKTIQSENESILFNPYDRRRAKYLLDKHPRLRAYLKLNSVNSLAEQKKEELREHKKRREAELFLHSRQGFNVSSKIDYISEGSLTIDDLKKQVQNDYKEEIKAIDKEIELAVDVLKTVVRLEIDFRENHAIRNHYSTANFYALGLDNRKEIEQYFKTHFNNYNLDVTIQQAVDYIKNDGNTKRKGSIPLQLLMGTLGIPFDKQVSILGLDSDTQHNLSNKTTAQKTNKIRAMVKKQREACVLIGEGQNITVLPPYKQALSYIYSTYKLDFKEIFNSVKAINYSAVSDTQKDIITLLSNNRSIRSLRSKESNTLRYDVSKQDLILTNEEAQTSVASGLRSLTTNQILDLVANGVDTHTRLTSLGISEETIRKLLSSGDLYEIRPRQYKTVELRNTNHTE